MIKTESNKLYFYDGSILLAEKVGDQITKIYINDGQGIVGMVRPIYDGSNQLTHYQRLYYLYDSLGSVSAITGEHGLPLQNYTYSPFGTCLNVTGDPINNLQFVGRYGGYLDYDTGLTYFWHRWYDSKDGRWISRDPIGVRGGINLYGYVRNQPQSKRDPSGYGAIGACEEGLWSASRFIHDRANECFCGVRGKGGVAAQQCYDKWENYAKQILNEYESCLNQEELNNCGTFLWICDEYSFGVFRSSCGATY